MECKRNDPGIHKGNSKPLANHLANLKNDPSVVQETCFFI